jgi:hypothetical protein
MTWVKLQSALYRKRLNAADMVGIYKTTTFPGQTVKKPDLLSVLCLQVDAESMCRCVMDKNLSGWDGVTFDRMQTLQRYMLNLLDELK